MDLVHSFDRADPYYQLAVAAAQYAEILRQSPWAYEYSISQVTLIAVRLARMLPEDPDVLEFADLVSRAEMLSY